MIERPMYADKIILQMILPGGNYEGIKTMHVADFLLSGEY